MFKAVGCMQVARDLLPQPVSLVKCLPSISYDIIFIQRLSVKFQYFLRLRYFLKLQGNCCYTIAILKQFTKPILH